jgi:hypothetical protein
MLENSTPLHTHPATQSSITQKFTDDAHKQRAYACDSFQTEDIEKQDEPKNSTLSSPVHSDDTNADKKENQLQTFYNTLNPTANCKDLDETSDEEEFWKRWNTSNIEKGEKSQFIQRFHTNRAAEPKARSSKSVPRKPDASKTLLRTKNILRGLCKNGKLNKKCNRKIKWLDY